MKKVIIFVIGFMLVGAGFAFSGHGHGEIDLVDMLAICSATLELSKR